MLTREVRESLGINPSDVAEDVIENFVELDEFPDPTQWSVQQDSIAVQVAKEFELLETKYTRLLSQLTHLYQNKLYVLQNSVAKNGNILNINFPFLSSSITKYDVSLNDKLPDDDMGSYEEVYAFNKTERNKYLAHHIHTYLEQYIDPNLYPELIDKSITPNKIYNLDNLKYYLQNAQTFKFYLINLHQAYIQLRRKL